MAAMNNRQADLRIDFSRSLVGNGDHFPSWAVKPVLFAHRRAWPISPQTDNADLVRSRVFRIHGSCSALLSWLKQPKVQLAQMSCRVGLECGEIGSRRGAVPSTSGPPGRPAGPKGRNGDTTVVQVQRLTRPESAGRSSD